MLCYELHFLPQCWSIGITKKHFIVILIGRKSVFIKWNYFLKTVRIRGILTSREFSVRNYRNKWCQKWIRDSWTFPKCDMCLTYLSTSEMVLIFSYFPNSWWEIHCYFVFLMRNLMLGSHKSCLRKRLSSPDSFRFRLCIKVNLRLISYRIWNSSWVIHAKESKLRNLLQ